MSPSKKANKQDPINKTRSAQSAAKKTAVRSSRVATQKTQTKPKQPEQTEASITSKPSSLQTNILRALALLAVIAITLYIFSIRNRIEEFEAYGYAGIFFVALAANATVFIPAPGVAIVYTMGGIAAFNPIYVGLAAGTGGAIGELSGFLAGYSGQAIIERTDVYTRIKPWVEKYGGWAILVLSAIPNPFFDVAGVVAGIAKMRMRTFLFSVWIGQLIKMTLFAYAGKYSIEWIANFIK